MSNKHICFYMALKSRVYAFKMPIFKKLYRTVLCTLARVYVRIKSLVSVLQWWQIYQ